MVYFYFKNIYMARAFFLLTQPDVTVTVTVTWLCKRYSHKE